MRQLHQNSYRNFGIFGVRIKLSEIEGVLRSAMRWRNWTLFACIALSLNGHLLAVMGFQREFQKPGVIESSALDTATVYRFNSVRPLNTVVKPVNESYVAVAHSAAVSGVIAESGIQLVAASTPGLSSVKYLTSEDVHTRAAPVIDWVINSSALPSDASGSVIFTVWISADGVIDYFEIQDIESQQPWVLAAFSALGQTVMVPASLNERSVASVLTVELFIDNASF